MEERRAPRRSAERRGRAPCAEEERRAPRRSAERRGGASSAEEEHLRAPRRSAERRGGVPSAEKERRAPRRSAERRGGASPAPSAVRRPAPSVAKRPARRRSTTNTHGRCTFWSRSTPSLKWYVSSLFFQRGGEEVMAPFAKRILLEEGAPRIIRCDSGSEFKNRTMNELRLLMRPELQFSPAYWPQSNQCERTNRQVGEILRCMTNTPRQRENRTGLNILSMSSLQ